MEPYKSNDKLDDYLSDREESKILDGSILEQRKDELLLFLAEIGVSYSTEIARGININLDSTNQLLFQLKKLGFIDKINPHQTDPQPMFAARMVEFWAMGIWGHSRMRQFSWWILTLGGLEYLKVRYKGQHKRAHSALRKYYDLVLEEEPKPKEESEEENKYISI